MTRKVGYVGHRKRDGRWFARVVKDGKDITKFAKSQEHADWLLRCIQAGQELPVGGDFQPAEDNTTITFRRILDEFIALRITEPVYRNDKKINGVRSRRTLLIRCEVLRKAFGDLAVKQITPSIIETFKQRRLDTPTQYGRERSVADVNRVIEILNAVLLYATHWSRNEDTFLRSRFVH